MEEIKLYPGNKIASVSRYHGIIIVEVERITKTQIVLSNGDKLRIPFYGNSHSIGRHSYGAPIYKNLNDELLESHNKQKALYEVSRLKFSELSTEQLNEILKIAKP